MIYGKAQWFQDSFERVEGGWIAYKVFNSLYSAPAHWIIEEGSWITEQVDEDTSEDCSYGINLGRTEQWLQKYLNDNWHDLLIEDRMYVVWQVFIPDEAIIIAPHQSINKIRVNKCQLLKVLDTIEATLGW